MRKLVKVTKDDIRKGRKVVRNRKKAGIIGIGQGDLCLNDHCAIAEALKRAFKDSTATWTYGAGYANGKLLRAIKYKRVFNWVVKHDELKRVQPFNFFVEILEKGVWASVTK